MARTAKQKPEFPERVLRVVRACAGGGRIILCFRSRAGQTTEEIYIAEPSGRPVATASVRLAIARGALIPCMDGLFHETSQTFVPRTDLVD